MKHIIPLAIALTLALFPSLSSAQTKNDTASTDTVPPVAVISAQLFLDSTYKPASYHLQRAASLQTLSAISGTGAAVLAAIGLSNPIEDPIHGSDGNVVRVDTHLHPIVYIAGVGAVISIISYINSVSHLRDAGKALSRIHLTTGGITIDL